MKKESKKRRDVIAEMRAMNRAGMPPGDAHKTVLGYIMRNVVEEGDCLLWQGNGAAGCPLISTGNGTKMPARKLMLECHGRTLRNAAPTMRFCQNCGNSMCVALKHIVQRTPKENGQVHAKLGSYNLPLARAKAALALRARSKFSDEAIRELVAAPRSEVGKVRKKWGISVGYATDLRNGRYRAKEYVPTPFTGLGARV